MKKRILCVLLALVLVLGLCPSAMARYEDMEVSGECAEFIMSHEGFSAQAYSDGTGWYIGYGTACGEDDYPEGISEEEAEALLLEKLDAFGEDINSFLEKYNASVTQCQFDALASMTYNFGSSWLNTANRLPLYLSKGIDNYTDVQIVNAFAAWCHVDGEVAESLLQRRIAEARMFLYGDYSGDTSGWCYLLLDANGGELESDVACYKLGERYGALPSAEREGFFLDGWQTGDGTVLSVDGIAEGNLEVTAVWTGDVVYPDVPENVWYYQYVMDLSQRGVISGFDDDCFHPTESVTCGQALKLILLAAGYKEQEPPENGHWAAGYRDFAVKKGFIEEDAMSDLDDIISRDEIADLTAAALELDGGDVVNNPFADTSRDSVLALYSVGIVEGSIENGQRLFKGREDIQRSEISAIIWRVADYVDRTLILFYDYRVPINYDLPFNPYDEKLFSTVNNRVYYDDPYYDVQYGIDVSYYQKDIDWRAVSRDGIDFAILRVGYRGCSEGELFEDERFQEYIAGATNAGLDIGLYFFSQALTPEEAVEEAEFLLERIGDYDISYPIAFDWEPLNYSYSRTKDYDYSVLTDCALAFCETIADAGYTPMVYLNETFAYLRYDISRLSDQIIWLAHYTEQTDYQYDFQIWQYGSSGSVAGIEGRVDMDIAFVNFGKNR